MRVLPEQPRPREALQRRRFDLIKEQVTVATLANDLIEEVAGRLTETERYLRGRCPVCGNGNHSKALSVSLEKNLWYCFACGEGGDVIQLAQLASGFRTAPEAVAWLGFRYGVDLPERPDAWYRKQSRQEKLRERIEVEKRELKRRRLFRLLLIPELEKVAEPEREEETRIAWERFQKVPII